MPVCEYKRYNVGKVRRRKRERERVCVWALAYLNAKVCVCERDRDGIDACTWAEHEVILVSALPTLNPRHRVPSPMKRAVIMRSVRVDGTSLYHASALSVLDLTYAKHASHQGVRTITYKQWDGQKTARLRNFNLPNSILSCAVKRWSNNVS